MRVYDDDAEARTLKCVPPKPESDEGVEIAWRTVSGRSGRTKLTGKELEYLNDHDSTRMLHFLGLETIDADANHVSDEPEFLIIEICLDSGAGDHALSRVDIPGFTVEESAGSRAGRNFVAAGGKRIRNEGQALLHLLGDGGAGLRSVFQVAEVTRPLWSVGKICDQGFDAHFTAKKATISKDGKEVLTFERRSGLYLGMIRLRNPKYKPKDDLDFTRPSR